MTNTKDDDRRRSMRHIACVLAHVHRDEGATRSAVIRDISVEGALLYTRAHLAAGERVQLSLYLDGDGANPVVSVAEVVRAGPRPRAMADVWPYSAAVKFVDSLAALESKLAKIAEEQAKVFGSDALAVALRCR